MNLIIDNNGWLVRLIIDWLIDWLIGWLIDWMPPLPEGRSWCRYYENSLRPQHLQYNRSTLNTQNYQKVLKVFKE